MFSQTLIELFMVLANSAGVMLLFVDTCVFFICFKIRLFYSYFLSCQKDFIKQTSI
jgi:hypothetical protein